jgi:hypothetical protein
MLSGFQPFANQLSTLENMVGPATEFVQAIAVDCQKLFQKVFDDHGRMASAFNHCDFYSGNPFEEICVFWWDDGSETTEDY